jgi:hypothetical protein
VETTDGSAFDEPVRVLRCPAVVDAEWPARTSGPGGIAKTEGTIRVAGVEEVEVPAGTFSAVRVEWAFSLDGRVQKDHHTYWFAPGVGVVKETLGLSTWVLKSFTPGKD